MTHFSWGSMGIALFWASCFEGIPESAAGSVVSHHDILALLYVSLTAKGKTNARPYDSNMACA
jgi:hypothetical protein